ncbi:MAG: MBL fold metallo-hydrolase [Myxococcales bacterium]|jgi:phosphoribosyl 1,2-cyclic phosphodiesterase|nr:MBL fold metallo-hydrolase [Myxococcales bacterium]
MFSVTFWGVRGSIAAPGPETALFGGNTSCVEVVCGTRRIILDSGTGMRLLGQHLLREHKSGRATLADLSVFYSHLHWDHMQGLPFFAPLYSPASTLRLFGPKDLERALRTQMGEPGFPVRLEDVPARLGFRELCEGMVVELAEDLVVTCARLNHPGGVLAYRVQYQDHAIVYATDTEHYSVPDPKLVRLAAGADLLIYDAQYDDAEYSGEVGGVPRTGWGHSTFSEGIRVANAAGVGKLALFHHDPSHSDEYVAKIEAAAQRLRPGTWAAREGQTIVVAQASALPSRVAVAA